MVEYNARPIPLRTKICTVGKSLKTTIPKPIVETLNLKSGQTLAWYVQNSHMMVQPMNGDKGIKP